MHAPTPIPGRKGKSSIANTLIQALWPAIPSNARPSRCLRELQSICAVSLSFDVSASSIRSILYRHPEIFEKAGRDAQGTHYRLSEEFVEKNYEK